jgi:hypothetical protein
MAFLNKEKLRDKTDAATVSEHPLMKKRQLSVAEKSAYLQGCVLAALVDDALMSNDERRRVRSIGLSLGCSEDDINEAVKLLIGLESEDDKLSLVDDIVSLLKVEPIRGFFVEDFRSVIESSKGKNGDAEEIFDLIGARLYEDAEWQKNKALAKAKVDTDRLMRELEGQLVETVERDMAWPAEYDTESIFSLMDQYGIKEHRVGVLLSLLLLHAKEAYDCVKRSIFRMDHFVDHDRHRLDLCADENALKFMNYVKCMSDCASLNPCYAIVQLPQSRRWLDDTKYTLLRETDKGFFVSLECVDYSHRKSGASEAARKELLNLYKSLLDEFENMSQF